MMATAVNQLQSAVAQVQSQQSRLAGEQSSMMGGWKGDAASAFDGAFATFNADYSKVIRAMQGIQEALRANLANYTADEAANTHLSTTISSALNG
jgi:WXG100 family type VII secretion target